jgi:REP element-mobilizing transposase RayT
MFMLRPDAKTKQLFEFCLALAVRMHRVLPLAWVVMSNHYHLVVYDPRGNVPAFMQHLNRLLASAFNARWGRRENFWSSDAPCITHLVTYADVMEKIAYTLANPVTAGLVDSVAEWMGSSSFAYLDGKPKLITRPSDYFSVDSKADIPEVIALTLSAPLEEKSFAAWAKRVKARVAKIDKDAAARRKKDRKSKSMGMKAVLAKRHTDRPTRKAPPTKLRPHVACGEKQKRIGSLVRVKEFRWQYRDAQKRFADGEAGVVFPRGTYRMKHLAKVHIGKCPRFPKDELMKHIMRIPHDPMADAS